MNRDKLNGRQGSGSLAVQAALREIGVSFERIWMYARLPTPEVHAKTLSLRPALSIVEADHAA
ncbi:MAG TPA: hypothetical protein VKP66_03675 [Steroidobacteraceae bacterium]|nr:hypothetical protein [Steroidobacteraceae bacterium]